MEFALIPRTLELPLRRFGRPQQSGPLTVLPVFGGEARGEFTPPLSGLKLAGVRTYGSVELHNTLSSGVAIVPAHMGYIQDQAQNHALCGATFLGAGQKKLIDDACCVQAAQGGLLESREQWFFILPVALREQALQLRGQKSFGKLWDAIARLCQRFGQQSRGHLEQIICRQRAVLTQYQSRLELLPGQTGDLFFLGDRLIGVELAPSAGYFREVWMPLVCFCYGTAALEVERTQSLEHRPAAEPFPAHSLTELRRQLLASRDQRTEEIHGWLTRLPEQRFDSQEQERYLNLRLFTTGGVSFAGQYVSDGEQLVYASLTARGDFLKTAMDGYLARN